MLSSEKSTYLENPAGDGVLYSTGIVPSHRSLPKSL